MTILTDRFSDALAYAEQAHRTQLRKGTRVPYVSHLLAVASLVLEYGGDEDQAIAATLHDIIEDQGGAAMADAVRARFGERVADIVRACSEVDSLPPWQVRKEAYIASVETKPADALLVTMADKLHNVTGILEEYLLIGDAVWPRFSAGRDGQLWYYRTLADVLARRLPGPLANRLARAVAALEASVAETVGSEAGSVGPAAPGPSTTLATR